MLLTSLHPPYGTEVIGEVVRAVNQLTPSTRVADLPSGFNKRHRPQLAVVHNSELVHSLGADPTWLTPHAHRQCAQPHSRPYLAIGLSATSSHMSAPAVPKAALERFTSSPASRSAWA